MQAVYTDVKVSKLAPNNVYPIDAVNVLDAVKNLNEGDACAEEQHRQEAAAGLLQMQDNDQKGRKSKLKQKSGPPTPNEITKHGPLGQLRKNVVSLTGQPKVAKSASKKRAKTAATAKRATASEAEQNAILVESGLEPLGE